MKRSGFKTSGGQLSRSSPMKRTAPLRQRSKRQERAYAGDADAGIEGRRDFVARILAERPRCQVCALIGKFAAIGLICGLPLPKGWRPNLCGGAAVEVHEMLRRSAGGSITDDANVLSSCAFGHRWLHEHPKIARDIGLLRSRYASTPTTAPETP